MMEFTQQEVSQILLLYDDTLRNGRVDSLVSFMGLFDSELFNYSLSELGVSNDIIETSLSTGLYKEKQEWLLSFTSKFTKTIAKVGDKKKQGRILLAINEVSRDPLRLVGDTQKPLSGPLEGKWRRRIGDLRLIYHPEIDDNIIYLLEVGPRGNIY
jgi:mRNA interferase RelE/StbE